MKTLVKKEIRLLLPAWTGAMLLAVAPAWLIEYFLPHQNAVIYVPPPFFILPGLLLLGISAFGREFSAKTFSLLLSQPVVRNRAWRLKILMLALAFVVVLAAQTISWSLFIQLYPAYSSHYLDAFRGLWLWTIALFTGGLWTTLLFRQEIGAFWFTLLAPAAILTGVGILGDYLKLPERVEDRIGDLAVLLYSAAGFLFARHLFFRAQDTQWTGGNVFFWSRRSTEQTSSVVFGPFRNRYFTLLRKEIQLHDANLFLAGILFFINLAIVLVRSHVSNYNLKSILEFVWPLWLLMPLLIGCAAVAEERRLGVAESQLCQPVSRRAAFCIKFLPALILSIILGAVAPTLIERTLNFGITNWPDFWIFMAAPAIFFVSFYASTLSRSTIQAIGMAIAVSTAGCFVWMMLMLLLSARSLDFGYDNFYSPNYSVVGRTYLMTVICILFLPPVLTRLMFWNFKWLHAGWRLFHFNVAALVISFAAIFILTNLIFYRAWELLLPIQPPHGPARLSAESPVKLLIGPSFGDVNTMVALLPDGRLWQQEIDDNFMQYRSLYWERWEPSLNTHRYIGSNWTYVAANRFHILGIQRNGSLWRIPGFDSKIPMTQIDSSTNWLRAAGVGNGFLLLKKNGTLWLWGTSDKNELNEIISQDIATPPRRIDPGTNWTNLIPLGYTALAQKTDGTFWNWRLKQAKNGGYTWHLAHEQDFENQWLSYSWHFSYSVGIKTNGELWLFSQIETNWQNHLLANGGDLAGAGIPPYTRKVQLGSDSDWKAISLDWSTLLRKDGTLWRWLNPAQKSFHPVQLGRYSDWIALGPAGIALGADGNLCSWNNPSDHFLLAPSRKPVYMGNIFEGNQNDNQPGTKTDTP